MVSQRGGRVPRHKATGEPEGQIEGWFKTAKHRFGLHRFGQGTLLGVYRWFILSFISYILASPSGKAEGRGQRAEGCILLFILVIPLFSVLPCPIRVQAPTKSLIWWSSISGGSSPHCIVLYLLPSAFCLLPFFLAHWAYLSIAIAPIDLPDWGEAAEIAIHSIFPHLVVLLLLQDIERLRGLALSQGIDIQISRCKI